MSKKIEQLKAAVETAKQEKEAAERRYDAALQAVYAAEREANRNQKPTPAMLEILRKLNNGASIRKRRYFPYGHALVGDEQRSKPVRDSIVNGLLSREAIMRTSEDALAMEYSISDHGKTLIAN